MSSWWLTLKSRWSKQMSNTPWEALPLFPLFFFAVTWRNWLFSTQNKFTNENNQYGATFLFYSNCIFSNFPKFNRYGVFIKKWRLVLFVLAFKGNWSLIDEVAPWGNRSDFQAVLFGGTPIITFGDLPSLITYDVWRQIGGGGLNSFS